MRSVLLAAALLLMPMNTLVCQAASPAPVNQVEKNKAVVLHWLIDGDNKNNPAIADEVFAPEILMHHPTSPMPLRGIETIKQGVVGMRAAFPDYAGSIDDIFGAGDRVVVRWTLRGTHKGEFMGAKPSGKKFALPGISIYKLAGGKIVEGWYGVNMLDLFQQLDVAPPSPPKP